MKTSVRDDPWRTESLSPNANQPIYRNGWPVSGRAAQDQIVLNPNNLDQVMEQDVDSSGFLYMMDTLMEANDGIRGRPPQYLGNPEAGPSDVVGGVIPLGYKIGYVNQSGAIQTQAGSLGEVEQGTPPLPSGGSLDGDVRSYNGPAEGIMPAHDPSSSGGSGPAGSSAGGGGSTTSSPAFWLIAIAVVVLVIMLLHGPGNVSRFR